MSKAYDFLDSMNGSTPEEEKSGAKAYDYLKSINEEADKPPEVVAEAKPLEIETPKPEADKPGFFKSLFPARRTIEQYKNTKAIEDEKVKKSEYEKGLMKNAQVMGISYVNSLKPEDKSILISALQKEKNKYGVIRAATDQDLPMGDVADPRDPENFLKYEMNKDNFSGVSPDGKKMASYASTAKDDSLENIGVALNMGRDQVFGTLGAIGEWANVSDGSFRKLAEKSQEKEQSKFNKPMDVNDNNIADPRFWTQKVPQSIPFMIALAPAQVAGAGVGAGIATRLGLGTFGEYLTTAGFAGLGSRFTEGIAEGGQTYAELKDKGVSDEVASSKAWKTTQANMALVFSDITQMAATFAPVKKIFPKIGSSTLGKFAVGGGKFIYDGATEGGEEVFQGYVQQYNVKKGLGEEPLSVSDYLRSDEAQNAFVLGATSGMMFGGIGVAKDVYDNFEKRAEAQVQRVEQAVDEDDTNFIQGMKFLQEKDVISEETVKATENLLATMVQEKKGVPYQEWVDTINQAKETETKKIAQKLESIKNDDTDNTPPSSPQIDQDKKEEYKGLVQDMIEVQGDTFFEKDGKIWKQPAVGKSFEGNTTVQTPEFRQALIEEGAIPEPKVQEGATPMSPTKDKSKTESTDPIDTGIVEEWGTKNQYTSEGPYAKELATVRQKAKTKKGRELLTQEDLEVFKKQSRYELEQVGNGKPAYLNDSTPEEEVRQYARDKGLVIGRDDRGTLVVAESKEAMNKVINAKNQRELGLALGYQDIQKKEEPKSGTDIDVGTKPTDLTEGAEVTDISKKETTQEEKVIEAVAGEEKTIKEISGETGILEPNVRRILGQGAKAGKFKRVAKGVYTLDVDGGTQTVIKVADALEEMPKLVAEGYKTDMVFLDIPYKTAAVTGGNRGVKYDLISPSQFREFLKDLKKVLKNEDSPVYHMYSTAPSGLKEMTEYNKQLDAEGFTLIDTGYWTKTTKNGELAKNMRGNVQSPEGIALYTLSGKVSEYAERNLSFKLQKTNTASEKPVGLIKSLIEQGTIMGNMVFDPFAGSGVVAEVATREGRSSLSIEMSEKRVEEEIIPRVEKVAGVKKNDGIIGKPDANFTLYTKLEGETNYKLTNLKGSQVESKIYAPIIQKEKFDEFVKAVRITASENKKTEFQIRQFNSKILYDSSKDETLPEAPKPKQEVKPATTAKTEIKDITEKAIAVVGYTMDIKDKLKEIGGKWNSKYKGWIFSKKRREQVQGIIDENERSKNTTTGQEKPKDDNTSINNPPVYELNTRPVSEGEDRQSQGDTSEKVTSGQQGAGTIEPRDGLGGETATSNRGIGKKGRAAINEKAKAILESKNFSTDAAEYSPEELDTLQRYTGAGGKEDAGATGRGLLDEYYTPREVVDNMWNLAIAENPRIKSVFEPTAGVGRFIQGRTEEYEISGMEIDKVSGTIAQIFNPGASIKVGDFQNLFITSNGKAIKNDTKYDLIIGNPPYGDRGGILKGLGEEGKIGKQEEYFIKRGIDMLNPGGVVSFIVPSSFLKNGKSYAKERIVAAGGELVNAYRLPEGVFEDTSIGTDIVVIKKTGNGSIGDFMNDAWFESHPDTIIGTIGTRKNRFGKQEEFVSGDKEETFKKIKEIVSNLKKSQEDTKVVEPLERIPEPTVAEEKPTRASTPRTASKVRTEKVVDVAGVRTTDKQVLNDWNSTPEEIEIFQNTNTNGTVEYRKEWSEYLNYYEGGYYHDINYFSGDIRDKLRMLELEKDKMSPVQYDKQKKGLEKVKPKDKGIQEISFDPLDRFVIEFPTGGTKEVLRERKWEIIPKTIRDGFGDYMIRVNRDLLGHGVQIGDVLRYVDGDRARADTKAITGYIRAEAKRFFNEYIKTALDYETQQKIAEKYNNEKNAYVRPQYDRIPVQVEGMAEEFRGRKFHLSETQKGGVGFLINKGSGMVAYGVGVGKTHTLIVATVANMQKGWTKRPLFIVPGSTLEKTWIQTIKGTFPGVKINNLEGLQAPVIRRLTAERGLDYTKWIKDDELSIITHDGILKLGFKNEELFELTRDMEDALGSFDREATDRNREKDREKIQEELGKALRGQSEISFTDLGFDHISVDEVHNFRKVFQGAKIEENKDGEQKTGKRFGNVIGGVPSTRARKLFLLSQAVQKKNKGRNVFLASATPFENHATEIYNILSFMARDRLKQMGIFNINDFFTTYANFQTENVMKADGNFENKDVMKSFANLSELQKLIQEFIDFKEDETLVRPDKKVLTPQLKMSPKQKEVQASIIDMLKSGDDGVVLKASTYAKSNAVSPFFVAEFMGGPTSLSDFIENSPKIQYTLEMVKELRKDPKTKERGNFIYIGKEGVSYTQYYIDYLTKDGTYKPSQIAVITGEISIEKREEIKDKFNSGEIKVLIGGDPTKEGIDLQQNGYATFIVSLGWNPTEMKQVEGRVWRQGNNASQVLMVYPLIENSGDIKIYQLMEEKGGRINDVFSYSEGSAVFDLGEIDPKEKKLMLLTDPVAKANLSILIDSDRINGELLYTKGQKEDLVKQQARYDTNTRSIKDLNDRLAYVTDEERQKDIKKEIKKAELDNTGINKKLEEKGITTIASEIEKLDKRIAELEEQVTGVKLQFNTLLEKYTQEEIDNLKLTKTLENHRDDIKKVNESLFYKSEIDLATEKAKKIEVNDAKIAAQRQQSRVEGNRWIYDIVGESYKSFIGNERISIEDSYIEAMRLAPDGWRVEIRPSSEMGQTVAFADLEKKLIVISETEVKKTTASHEVVHASLSELPKDRQEVLIRLSQKQWRDKAGRDITEEEAEEFLAEEFKYYANKKKFQTKSLLGKIKEFLISIGNKIFGKKPNQIKEFYEDILSGALKSKDSTVAKKFDRIREENIAYLDRFIEQKNQEGRVDKEAPPRLGPNYDFAPEEKVEGQFWDSFKSSIQAGFEPLDTTIGNIDRDLKNRLIRFEQQVANSNIIQESVLLIESLKEKLKGVKNTEEYKILDIALKNGDVENINYYSKKLDIEAEIEAAKKLLELIYGDAIKVGMDVGYLEQYFPRTVKDSSGLLAYIYGTQFEGGIREAIAKEEAKLGGVQLSDEEKAAIVNKMLRGYKINGISLLGPGNVKARALEQVGKETNPFYEDSFDSLAYYIRGMNENIQARIFFGDVYSKEEQAFMRKARNIKRETERIDEKIKNTDNPKAVEKLMEQKKKIQEDLSIEQVKAFYDDMRAKGKQDYLASSISAWVLKLIADGKITPIQEMALTRALNARFKRGRMSNWVSAYKNISYITTMGSVISTISQLADLGWSIVYNGYLQTGADFGKSIIGSSRIKKRDILPSEMFYEFQEGNGGLRDAVAKVFRMIGLTKLVDMGQETLINGAYKTIQKRVLSGDLSDLAILPDEAKAAAVEAFKNDLVSDDIKAVLFGVMYHFAPIAPSRLPAFYNTSGNGRVFYMLKSFLIVQIDVFRQDAIKDIKDGTVLSIKNPKAGMAQVSKGTINLLRIAIALMLMNASADILKNFLLNRPFDLSSIMVDNILKLAGFSKYTTYKIKEEGLMAGAASIILPPFNIGKDIVDDIYDIVAGDIEDPTKLQSINNIPIAGKLFYWWFGKGADKSDKKRDGQVPDRTKSRGLQNL